MEALVVRGHSKIAPRLLRLLAARQSCTRANPQAGAGRWQKRREIVMGFFGTYLFDGQRWMTHEADKLPTVPEPWLLVDIHDSDIATIAYRPIGSGSGVAYLGVTPRTYFEDPGASAPSDVAREAGGLVEW